MTDLRPPVQASAEGIARMLDKLRLGLIADVARREEMTFTDPNVSTALAEICAQLDALASVQIAMLRSGVFGND